MTEYGLKQKINQLIIARLDGGKITGTSYLDYLISLVRQGIGGFIIFGGKADQVRRCIHDLQGGAEIPLFIASDVERGVGQQVGGMTYFPPQMALAAASGDDILLAEGMARAVLAECRYLGINMPLIPVVDINSEPGNPIICTRAFSDDADLVSRFGSSVVKVLESQGMMSCVKHFPGHGSTAADSHIELPVIKKSLDDLYALELIPFKAALKAGASSVMAGHLSVPEIDDLPASLSPRIINDMLRNDLGFDGLVLTDALNMHALDEIEDVEAKCLAAGADILLHPSDPSASAESVMKAVESGQLPELAVDQAFQRIMKFKGSLVTKTGEMPDLASHDALSRKISDLSIAQLKTDEALLPLHESERVSLIIFGDREGKHSSYIKGQFRSDQSTATAVIALFTEVAAWRGSSGLQERDIEAVREVIESADKSIVVSFGSPYVLGHFPGASALIAAFDSSERAQRSACDCLRGLKRFGGTMPVKMAGYDQG